MCKNFENYTGTCKQDVHCIAGIVEGLKFCGLAFFFKNLPPFIPCQYVRPHIQSACQLVARSLTLRMFRVDMDLSACLQKNGAELKCAWCSLKEGDRAGEQTCVSRNVP